MTTHHQTVASGMDSLRALVVDDSASMRKLLVAMMQALDFIVAEASDGSQAFEQILVVDYAVVVTDIVMPGVDGIQLIAAISLLPAERQRPQIIACTGLDRGDRLMQAPELRLAHAILQKPVRPITLANAVLGSLRVRQGQT